MSRGRAQLCLPELDHEELFFQQKWYLPSESQLGDRESCTFEPCWRFVVSMRLVVRRSRRGLRFVGVREVRLERCSNCERELPAEPQAPIPLACRIRQWPGKGGEAHQLLPKTLRGYREYDLSTSCTSVTSLFRRLLELYFTSIYTQDPSTNLEMSDKNQDKSRGPPPPGLQRIVDKAEKEENFYDELYDGT